MNDDFLYYPVGPVALKNRGRLLKSWLWAYAVLVAFYRIYNASNYPGDLLGGFLFGAGAAYFFYLFYAVIYHLISFE